MSSISSDLYEELLKSNKSHTNHIIQIVSCKTAFKKAVHNPLTTNIQGVLQNNHLKLLNKILEKYLTVIFLVKFII